MRYPILILMLALFNSLLSEDYHTNLRSTCARDPLDITFVLDSSASISKDDFEKKLRPAVKTLIEVIIPGYDNSLRKSRVSCVVFSSVAHVSWSFDTYKTKEELYKAVNNLNYEGSNNTAFGDALNLVLTQLHPLVQQNVRHIVIIIAVENQIGADKKWLDKAEKIKASRIPIFVIDLGALNEEPFVESISRGWNYRVHITHYIDLITQIENIARLECMNAVSTCIYHRVRNYFTWDNNFLYHYGPCLNMLARDNCKDGIPQGEPTFSVIVNNGYLTHSYRTGPNEIFLHIPNTTIILQQSYGVVVNGRSITLPYLPLDAVYTIQMFGLNVKISFKNGMAIDWNGSDMVSVTLTEYMQNTVCRLCGNYNGIRNDDWVSGPACGMNGKKTRRDFVFGDSWRIVNPDGTESRCEPTCRDKYFPLSRNCDVAGDGDRECRGLIKQFGECGEAMENDRYSKLKGFVQACLLDYVAEYPDVNSVLCQYASLLATICLLQYKISISYMDNTFCPPKCGANMVYNKTGSPCQASCTQLGEDMCHSNMNLPVERCFCEVGYVMESGKCILPSQCGCKMSDSSYFKVGSNYTTDDCSQFCECQTANNNLLCRSVACDVNAMCQKNRGIRGCYCKKGYQGNGFNCTEINECEVKIDSCDVNAECINSIGSYSCTCKRGYRGSGHKGACYDIDECKLQNHTCDVNAECSNNVGSYSCTCRPGFAGSGQKDDCYGSKDYFGCYKDDLPRDLNSQDMTGNMSPEICRNFCLKYRFFGLQNRNHCFCGNSYGSYGIGTDSECHFKCEGNDKYRCGGDWMNAVYSSQGYIGCFIDDEIRDLNEKYKIGDMEPSICRTYCADYKYFGLQDHNFCFCGNSYGRHGRATDGECNTNCQGNPIYICGGVWRNAIHRVVI